MSGASRPKSTPAARSSALHAYNMRLHERRGRPYVSFEIHPLQRATDHTVATGAEVIGIRSVRSSSGQIELRPVIETTVALGRARLDDRAHADESRRDGLSHCFSAARQFADAFSSTAAVHTYRAGDAATTMKIAILSRKSSLYSTRRIKEAGEARGHRFR
jgi:ribosomal protein S6--L-glutamate ligase